MDKSKFENKQGVRKSNLLQIIFPRCLSLDDGGGGVSGFEYQQPCWSRKEGKWEGGVGGGKGVKKVFFSKVFEIFIENWKSLYPCLLVGGPSGLLDFALRANMKFSLYGNIFSDS